MQFINNKKLTKLPVISTNVSGKIIKMNQEALCYLQNVKIGADIFSIIDADKIRKFSMYRKKIQITKTSNKEYPNAFMRLCGDGISKTIEILLIEKNVEFDESDLVKISKIFSTYEENKAIIENAKCKINDMLKKIIEKLREKKEFFKKDIKLNVENNYDIDINISQIDILFISVISILNDMNFISPVSINVLENKSVEFSVEYNDFEKINDFYDICAKYNYITPKVTLVLALCDSENIRYSISNRENEFKISFDLSYAENKNLDIRQSLYIVDTRLDRIIDTLLPTLKNKT